VNKEEYLAMKACKTMRCTCCKQTKAKTEFPVNHNVLEGYGCDCKDCAAEGNLGFRMTYDLLGPKGVMEDWYRRKKCLS